MTLLDPDVVGMFPNVPVKKTLDVVKEELQNDERLRGRTDWKVEDISKLLEISVETYFKTLDGKVYFQMIYMHWFEKEYVFNEDGHFKGNIVFWERQMDDVFFVWRGKGGFRTVCVELNGHLKLCMNNECVKTI